MRLYRISDRAQLIENCVTHVTKYRPTIAQVVFDCIGTGGDGISRGALFGNFAVEFVSDFRRCADCDAAILNYAEDMTRYEYSQQLPGQAPFRLRSQIEHEVGVTAASLGFAPPAFNAAAALSINPLHAQTSLLGRWFCCYGTDMKLRCLHCDAEHRHRVFVLHPEPSKDKGTKAVELRGIAAKQEFGPGLKLTADTSCISYVGAYEDPD